MKRTKRLYKKAICLIKGHDFDRNLTGHLEGHFVITQFCRRCFSKKRSLVDFKTHQEYMRQRKNK